ncbi:MAG: hypothetical protein KAR00_00425 [Candidatus Pacebacteria bacterium]|nr:hypothetical protein [Candidatus Paceibacterota bacterium]
MLKNTRAPFFIVIVLGVLIAVLQHTALIFDLYWVIKWLDLVMHIFGGAWIAFLSFWFLFHFSFFQNRKGNSIFVADIVFLSTLIVGILWEVFESQTGLTSVFQYHYWGDTFSDLLMDSVGALVAGFFLVKSPIGRHLSS